MCKSGRVNAGTWDLRWSSCSINCGSVTSIWVSPMTVWKVCCMRIKFSVKGGGEQKDRGKKNRVRKVRQKDGMGKEKEVKKVCKVKE